MVLAVMVSVEGTVDRDGCHGKVHGVGESLLIVDACSDECGHGCGHGSADVMAGRVDYDGAGSAWGES